MNEKKNGVHLLHDGDNSKVKAACTVQGAEWKEIKEHLYCIYILLTSINKCSRRGSAVGFVTVSSQYQGRTEFSKLTNEILVIVRGLSDGPFIRQSFSLFWACKRT